MGTAGASILLSITTLIGFTSYATVTECGIKKSSSRIVGGKDSGGYHYPWFGLLVLKNNEDIPVCAGSLITPHHVLTAAHCFSIKVSAPKEEFFNVLMGVYDRCNRNETGRQSFAVSRVDVHEEYKNGEKFHDIALMTLDRPADYTVICLPPPGSSDATQPAVLIGYGVTKQGGKRLPCHMMEANIIKYSKKDCTDSDLPREDIAEGSVICAGKLTGGVDSCQGDSGGPLLTVTSTGQYIITGIVSYGYGCANPGLPGIYTDVSSYLSWIGSHVSRAVSASTPSARSKHERFYNGRKVKEDRPRYPSRVIFPDQSVDVEGSAIDSRDSGPSKVEKETADPVGTVYFPRENNSTGGDSITHYSGKDYHGSVVTFPNDEK